MRFNAKSAPTGFMQVRREERDFESGLYHTGKHSLWAVSVILINSLWTLRIDTMKPGRLCDITASPGSMNTLYYRNFAADSNMLTLWFIRAENPVAWDICPFPEHTTVHLRKALKWRLCNSRLNAPPKEWRSTKVSKHTQLLGLVSQDLCSVLSSHHFTNEFHDQQQNVYTMWVRSAWAGQ